MRRVWESATNSFSLLKSFLWISKHRYAVKDDRAILLHCSFVFLTPNDWQNRKMRHKTNINTQTLGGGGGALWRPMWQCNTFSTIDVWIKKATNKENLQRWLNEKRKRKCGDSDGGIDRQTMVNLYHQQQTTRFACLVLFFPPSFLFLLYSGQRFKWKMQMWKLFLILKLRELSQRTKNVVINTQCFASNNKV